MTHIKIVDRPCGYGKSSLLLRNFKITENYLVVVPSLSEVDRFIEGAYQHSQFRITQPLATEGRKSDHAEKLIREGKSLVCTHSLFYRLGTIATQTHADCVSADFDGVNPPEITTQNMLHNYNLIIDEVVSPFEHERTVRPIDFDNDYIALGMATIGPDGRVEPTQEWDKRYEQGSSTFDPGLYQKAKSGALYKISDGLFVLTAPKELLLGTGTVTIFTYLSEGSVLLQFLRKLRAENPGLFTLEVDRLDQVAEREWRQDVASALSVKSIPGLEKVAWNHTAQLKDLKGHKACAAVGHELRKFKETELSGVNRNAVMLTSARAIWCGHRDGERPLAGRVAKHSRLFGHAERLQAYHSVSDITDQKWSTTGVQFVPNQTRGTNNHIACTHAIYLYDQNPNPQLLTFLGWKRNDPKARQFSDAYALTELVQWLFRCCIRVGGINSTPDSGRPRQRATVYIPSERMRNLLNNWLETGEVTSARKDRSRPKHVTKSRKRRLSQKVPA